MNGKRPTRKVTGGALAGALSVLAVLAAQQFGITVSAELSSSFTTVLTLLTSYFVADSE